MKAVLASAVFSLLVAAGCAAPSENSERTRFACYDARGRYAATVTTQGECERRFWTWRQVTE